MATAGVAPRLMGFGQALAVEKVLALTGLGLDQIEVIDLNAASVAQGLAVLSAHAGWRRRTRSVRAPWMPGPPPWWQMPRRACRPGRPLRKGVVD